MDTTITVRVLALLKELKPWVEEDTLTLKEQECMDIMNIHQADLEDILQIITRIIKNPNPSEFGWIDKETRQNLIKVLKETSRRHVSTIRTKKLESPEIILEWLPESEKEKEEEDYEED